MEAGKTQTALVRRKGCLACHAGAIKITLDEGGNYYQESQRASGKWFGRGGNQHQLGRRGGGIHSDAQVQTCR
jgi:cytochrome c551/c552